MRPPGVSKSHSFGGYTGAAALTRGDSAASAGSARLAKQGTRPHNLLGEAQIFVRMLHTHIRFTVERNNCRPSRVHRMSLWVKRFIVLQ